MDQFTTYLPQWDFIKTYTTVFLFTQNKYSGAFLIKITVWIICSMPVEDKVYGYLFLGIGNEPFYNTF